MNAINNTNIFWTERRHDFIKLCFAFTPELDEDLCQVDSLYSKIKEQIILKNYRIYALDYGNKEWSINVKNEFDTDGFIKILLPINQEIDIEKIKELFSECSFNSTYHSFFSNFLAMRQAELEGAIIVAHTQLIKCKDFKCCPLQVDPYFVSTYSVDLYGKNIQSLCWNLDELN